MEQLDNQQEKTLDTSKRKCPCETDAHGGIETLINKNNTQIHACDNHLQIYLSTGWTIVESKPLEDKAPTDVKCPVCHESDVSVYKYQGAWEAWCGKDSINFVVETGKIIPIDDDDTPPTDSHLMDFDGKFYKCDTCSFETQFMTEAIQHENSKKTVTTETKKESNLHYTSWKSDSLWICKYCNAEFTDFQSALKHDTPEGRQANILTSAGGGYKSYEHCKHLPQKIVQADPGVSDWELYAGRKWDCEPHAKEYDIILNLSGSRLTSNNRHEIPIKELKKWESKPNYKEIMLDWPDRGVVQLPKEFWKDLIAYADKMKYKILVFCMGGHGRTGTAVASILVTAMGYTPKDAVEWVWANYCEEAIETDSQIQYVYGLAGQKYTSKKEAKTQTTTQTNNQTSVFPAWEGD